ncbi:MAG: ABC transporter permease [Anaerolineales bacterium]|nr:ABC transporter permease [Anaerolineales bacterium]
MIVKPFLISLLEKKARTLLVLFSISISAALVFANECFARTVERGFYESGVRWSGDSDLIVETQNAVGAEEWIDPARLAAYAGGFQYAQPAVRQKALYAPGGPEMHWFTILGVDVAEFDRRNPLTLHEGAFAEWSGNTVIIGQTYADLYGLRTGDVMRLELNNAEYDFRIAGVAAPRGLFLRELADGGFLLAPRETLARIFGGECNILFLKLRDGSQVEAVKEQLTADLPGYRVEYGVNESMIASETQTYVMPFWISSAAVVFMCMFIIFAAFHLITLELIPLIGTLRSVGATRRRINAVLIGEAAALGALGGLAGCVLGVGVLEFIKSRYAAGDDIVLNTAAVIGAREALTAVAAATAITAAGAVVPILRMTKIPIRNIILNEPGKGRSRPSRLWAAGAALLAACPLVTPLLPGSFAGMIAAAALVAGALAGLVLLIPFLTRHAARLAARIPGLGQEIVLGIRNIHDNRSLMNNIQLFSASIAIVAFMASLFGTMGADLVKSYERDCRYDISLTLRHSDPETLAALAGVEGVEATAGSHQYYFALPDRGVYLNVLYGIENADFFEFNRVGGLEAVGPALADLSAGRNIILTNVLKDKLGLKAGDALSIQFSERTVPYTVTGFVETNDGIGHVGYISAANFRADAGVSDYDYIYIKAAGSADSVKNNILRALGKEVMRIDTKRELMQANADKVVGIFTAINTYAQLALLTGILGIVNNLAASFLERKRSFAMLRCVGMSKRSLNRMLVAEAAAMGVLGTAFGLACALVMSAGIPAVVSVMWGKVEVMLAAKEMAAMGAAGILAMLAISAVPVMSIDRLSLVQTLKYE